MGVAEQEGGGEVKRDAMMTDHQAEVLQSCNRHMARLLCDLEEAQCPKVYREIVKRAMQYMRHDMLVLSEECSASLLTIPRNEW